MAKIHQEDNSCRKARSVQIFQFQQYGQVPTDVTRKSLSIWSHEMNQWEAERVIYWIGIQNFRGFGIA
jgi:hypothetical protein